MTNLIQQAQKALAAWDLQTADITLAAQRENTVFRVEHTRGTFALRQHRQGYHTAAALKSELDWITALAAADRPVPQPIATLKGALLHTQNNQNFSLITWLPGTPMGITGTPLTLENRRDVFHALGAEMARLHSTSDQWIPPKDFTRTPWDADGLVGDTPHWNRFWDNPALTKPQASLFADFRDTAQNLLTEIQLDYGLIHADLLRENVLIDGDIIRFIDFDDSGPGYRLFDLATTLLRNGEEPDIAQLSEAMIAGYHSQRPLDLTHLPLFMALRACTYVGWVMTRPDLENHAARTQTNIARAITHVQLFFEN